MSQLGHYQLVVIETITSMGGYYEKVELRMNEQNKYEIIKKLVDTNGNKKRATTKLGCIL